MPSRKTTPRKPNPLPYFFYATDEVGNSHWINLSCAHRIAITHPPGSPQELRFMIYFSGGEEIPVTSPEEVADLTKRLDGAGKLFKLRADKLRTDKPKRKH